MKKLISSLILFLLPLAVFAQSKVPIGGSNPKDTSWVRGFLMVDSNIMVKGLRTLSGDTAVLGFDATGKGIKIPKSKIQAWAPGGGGTPTGFGLTSYGVDSTIIQTKSGYVDADVRRITATQGQTVFNFGVNIPAQAAKYILTRNFSVEIAPGTYTNNTTNITFNTGMDAGDVISLRLQGYGAGSTGGSSTADPVTEAFTQVIAFNAFTKLSSTSLSSADVHFTLASSGNIPRATYEVEIYPDGVHNIYIDSSAFYVIGTVDRNQVNYILFNYPANSSIKPTATVRTVPTYLPLAAATNLSATGAQDQLSLNWDDVPNATQYNIYRSAHNANTFVQVGSSMYSNFVDVGLSSLTQYDYKIGSTAYGFTSSMSAVFSGTTTAPTTVRSFAVATDNNVITVADAGGNFNFGTSAFSIGFLFKTNATSGAALFTKSDGTAEYWGISYSSGGAIGIVLQGPAGNYLYGTYTAALNNGAWHSIVATYSGGTSFANLKMYVDGSLVTLTDLSTTGFTGVGSGGTVKFGYSNQFTSANRLVGKMDNAFIANRVLTPTEVTEYNNGNVSIDPTTLSFTSALTGAWLFDSNLSDAKGNGHTGTATTPSYSTDVR